MTIVSLIHRAEAAARASAQKAIDDAETRARIAREGHEKSAKKLDDELMTAKVRFEHDEPLLFLYRY